MQSRHFFAAVQPAPHSGARGYRIRQMCWKICQKAAKARREAAAILSADPLLDQPQHRLLADQVSRMFDRAGPMN